MNNRNLTAETLYTAIADVIKRFAHNGHQPTQY